MLVPISEIKVNAGRREADPEGVQELVDSISKVGLLNPITIDREHTLIAGLYRLEAAKLLGWTEIECNVSSLEGLLAELAEVDENVVRKGLSAVEYSDLLLHRKEIYEALHPETRAGIAQAAGMNRAVGNNAKEVRA
jgi:ParB family chromosome partitioning protein